jgi:SNF family Na+-dependent transporter
MTHPEEAGTSTAAHHGRDETPEERADRNWAEILQELRAVQTGTQILTGFLLAVAFQPAFADLETLERTFYLCLVVLAGIATILAMAPVIMHRMLFRQRQKDRLVRIGSGCMVALLAVVSALVAGVSGFIFDVTVDRLAGLIAVVVAVLVVASAWIVVPRLGRPDGGTTRISDRRG